MTVSRNVMIGSGTSFTPLSLSPLLWLDASDTATITQSGGNVSAWADKSGNGRNVSQVVAGTKPKTNATTQNGLNVIDFVDPSGGDYLDYDAGSDALVVSSFTLFIVAKMPANSPAGFRRLFSMRTSATGYYDFQLNNFGVICSNSTSPLRMAVVGNTVGSPYMDFTTAFSLFTMKTNSSLASISLNAATALSTSGNASVPNQRYIRVPSVNNPNGNPPGNVNTSSWKGSIAEIVAVPSDCSVDACNTYLQNKWGI